MTVNFALKFVETSFINITVLTGIKLPSAQPHTCYLRYPYEFYEYENLYRFLSLRFTLVTRYEI